MPVWIELDSIRINLENYLAALFPFQRHKPLPNTHKAQLIRSIQQSTKCGVFLETGTFKGDMLDTLKNNFPRLISIELDAILFNNAQKRFKQDRRITIIQGDSGKLMESIINPLDEPIFYWLDAHCDGEGSSTARGELYTPIVNEVKVISRHTNKTNKKPVILIDDADCFNGQNDYPELKIFIELAQSLFPTHKKANLHNIIQIIP